MEERYDVAVVGLGAMGSAAAYHLASRGIKTIGFDRYHPPHKHGSTSGQTRVYRKVYFEDPLYVPMLEKAEGMWKKLEEKSGETLFRKMGVLLMGPREGDLIDGSLKSAEKYGLEAEMLGSAELKERYPQFHIPQDMVGLYDPQGGSLNPEKSVEAHLELAKEAGADLHYEEAVSFWKNKDGYIEVDTQRGVYEAEKILLTAGAWTSNLVPNLGLPLVIVRQILMWFEPREEKDRFGPQECPIFIWEHGKNRYFYGFPNLGEGVKIAPHYQGIPTKPDEVDRQVHEDEIESQRKLLEKYMPAVNGDLLNTSVCMYTNTPDHHFLIDYHPYNENVLIASPCSGHGFKFSSLLGDILAAMLNEEEIEFDMSPFRLDRLGEF